MASIVKSNHSTRCPDVSGLVSGFIRNRCPDKPEYASSLGKAVTYALNQKEPLSNFLLDGRIEISNNCAENAIRPYVTGRKNWLFADTTRGAKASAIVYSMIESAKLNNLNPYMYLVHLLTNLPNLKELTHETLAPYLPWSPELPSWCRNEISNAPLNLALTTFRLFFNEYSKSIW